jgi:phosphonoacetate hydrolase
VVPSFTVNDRTYVSPGVPVVVICIDGSEPDYHLAAMSAGQMPWLSRQLDNGSSSWPAHCAMPALTNPNNLSIATGRPPAVHGISGNYFFDVDRGEEVLMNDARFLRAPTIFEAANDAGWTVAVVTAKDKLVTCSGWAWSTTAGPACPRSRGTREYVFPPRRPIRPPWQRTASAVCSTSSAGRGPRSTPPI